MEIKPGGAWDAINQRTIGRILHESGRRQEGLQRSKEKKSQINQAVGQLLASSRDERLTSREILEAALAINPGKYDPARGYSKTMSQSDHRELISTFDTLSDEDIPLILNNGDIGITGDTAPRVAVAKPKDRDDYSRVKVAVTFGMRPVSADEEGATTIDDVEVLRTLDVFEMAKSAIGMTAIQAALDRASAYKYSRQRDRYVYRSDIGKVQSLYNKALLLADATDTSFEMKLIEERLRGLTALPEDDESDPWLEELVTKFA